MKKKIGLIVLMILISICSIGVVSAKEKAFSLTKAETGEKTDTTTVNKFSYKKDTITSDVTFHKVGDYVTYKLVLKNTTDDTLTIKSVTDNNSDKNVTYSYDSNKGVKIKSGNTLTLLVKAKYTKAETDTSKRTKKLSTTFTINYVEQSGKSGSSNINVNPGTSDKIMLFTGLFITSLVVILVVLINKKKKISKKATAILMILSLILPIGVSAATSAYNLSFSTTYKVMDKLVITLDINGKKVKKVIDYNTPLSGLEDPEKDGYKFVGWVTSDGKPFDITKPIKGDISIKAKFESKVAYLEKGNDITLKMISLTGAQDVKWVVDEQLSDAYNDYYVLDYTGGQPITKIKFAKESQYNAVKDTLSDDNIVSTSDSMDTAYVWFDSGTIYFYAASGKVYMNEDSKYMFSDLQDLTEIDLTNFDSSRVTTMEAMFQGTKALTSLDLSMLDVSNVTNMYSMFGDMEGLTDLNLKDFNSSKVTNMTYMFWKCESLTSLDLSSFDTSSVTEMEGMFSQSKSLISLDLRNFNTSNVFNMSSMFARMDSLQSVNLSSFNTSEVETMDYMFWDSISLKSVDLSSFDTSNVIVMHSMFANCTNLEEVNLTSFDTSNVVFLSAMFRDCSKLKVIDLSSFSSAKLQDSHSMFIGCTSLETIYANSELRLIGSQYASGHLFTGCTSLKGGAGTVFDSDHDNTDYARIDDPDNGKPGYFTAK